MEMAGSDPEDGQNDTLAQYSADIYQLVESNKVITHSFKALVALLSDQLPVLGLESLESVGLEEEAELEDVEE